MLPGGPDHANGSASQLAARPGNFALPNRQTREVFASPAITRLGQGLRPRPDGPIFAPRSIVRDCIGRGTAPNPSETHRGKGGREEVPRDCPCYKTPEYRSHIF